jgi:hypothetical protein
MTRQNGSVIGVDNTPTTSVASGVWSLFEQARYQKEGVWPTFVVGEPYFNYTTLLLHGDGTNGAQNNTFLDSSTNNFTITRNGNTTQGTFSPFSQTGWSNYFDGTGDYLSFTKQTTTSAFTCECWFYRGEDVGGYHIIFSGSNLGSANADNIQLRVSNAGAVGLVLAGTVVISETGTAVTKNQWNHIAWVRSGSSCAIFVNGSRIATGTSSAALNVVSIGTYLSSYVPNGYISNARITTTAVYDPSLTTCSVPTTPLTAITGTYLLTCQSNRFVDNSASPLALTVNGNPSVQAFSPFAPTAAYSAATVGGSGYFDGSGDYLTCNQVIDTADFTIEGWVYPTASGIYQTLFAQGTSGTSGRMAFYINNDQTMALQITTSYVYTTGTVKINSWNHVAVTRSSGSITIYINGVSSGTGTNSASIQATGGRIGVEWGTGYTTGYIGSLRVSNIARTITLPTAPYTSDANTELLLNFTNGGIIDNTAKNLLETVGNAQISTSVKKYGTGSLSFNGSGDWLVVSDSVNIQLRTGSFTIEAWIYPSATSGKGIVAKGTGGTDGWLFWLNSSNKLEFQFNASSTIQSSASISTDTWTHVAVVREGTGSNQTKLYINGVNDGTGTVSSDFNQTVVLRVGTDRGNNASNRWNGYIDDLRITKGVARYTTTFTPPTAAFADQ